MANYLIFVHGIGEQEPGVYNDFGNRIREATNPDLYWDEAYWADVTQPDEELLKKRVGRGGFLHNYYIGSFGDLVAYSKLHYPPDKYSEIQQRFSERVYLASKRAEYFNDTNACLSVIGHSMGSVIASDGLYNMISSGTFPQNMKLKCLFTLGSPLALYALRYGIERFTKPIRPEVWLNFYYPQDVAALALKPLNKAYNSAVTEDICLSPGSLGRRLISVLPYLSVGSHSWYFTDPRVISRIAEELG